MVELFANSGDPDQTPRSAASNLGLLCLPVTRLGVSSLNGLNFIKGTVNGSGIRILWVIAVYMFCILLLLTHFRLNKLPTLYIGRVEFQF